jgi:hypothetical protein
LLRLTEDVYGVKQQNGGNVLLRLPGCFPRRESVDIARTIGECNVNFIFLMMFMRVDVP